MNAQITKDDRTKCKSDKGYIWFFFVLGLLLLLGLVCPHINSLEGARKRDFNRRKAQLEFWRDQVTAFIANNNRMPGSLFEVVQNAEQSDRFPIRMYELDIKTLPKSMVGISKKEFDKYCDYHFSAESDNWMIEEKRAYPGLYLKRLAIDLKGVIIEYELEMSGSDNANKETKGTDSNATN
ncbi:MAG: hypothetical protein JXA82_00475 [Sedimentisphaerales bacterium]|nr:hypothetical protein [Sedimentisphaerales bacterium]